MLRIYGALLALCSCRLALASGGGALSPLVLLKEEGRAHRKRVASVAFAPDGKTVLSGSHDRSIATWDAGAAARKDACTALACGVRPRAATA